MNYKAPCEEYPDENYDFNVTIVDETSNEFVYEVDGNIRCNTCFLKEACAQKVIDVLTNEFDDIIPNSITMDNIQVVN